MFSKICVGLIGAVLLGVGGFICWDYQNGPSRNGCTNSGNGCSNTVAPCCLQQGEVEELTIMPREVSE